MAVGGDNDVAGRIDRKERLSMRIGVPTEIKPSERRVGMTPDGVHAVVEAGHEVFVQDGAGVGSGFDNAEYPFSFVPFGRPGRRRRCPRPPPIWARPRETFPRSRPPFRGVSGRELTGGLGIRVVQER